MSKAESSSRDKAVSAEFPPRHKPDHRPPEACSQWQATEAVDPHSNWLKKWRSLRTGSGRGRNSDGCADLIGELQNKIAHTPASTIAGLQAQAELISELAWNDVVAATARRLVAGLRRLRRSGAASP